MNRSLDILMKRPMDEKPTKTDNIILIRDNNHLSVAEISVTDTLINVYLPGDEEVYDWDTVQKDTDFINWRYLNETIKMEWRKMTNGVAATHCGIRISIELTPNKIYHARICLIGRYIQSITKTTLEETKIVSVKWVNDNLTEIPKLEA